MSCDYFKQSQIVIEYYGTNGELMKVYTQRVVTNKYIRYPEDIDAINLKEEMCKIIRKYNYNKILFQKNSWEKRSYKKKYEVHLLNLHLQPQSIIKIYKSYTAWENENSYRNK